MLTLLSVSVGPCSSLSVGQSIGSCVCLCIGLCLIMSVGPWVCLSDGSCFGPYFGLQSVCHSIWESEWQIVCHFDQRKKIKIELHNNENK